jgi:hypothetical protein
MVEDENYMDNYSLRVSSCSDTNQTYFLHLKIYPSWAKKETALKPYIALCGNLVALLHFYTQAS